MGTALGTGAAVSGHAKGSCLICQHDDRAEIDQAIADAEPYASIADRFGLSKTTIFDHKARGHVPDDVIADGAAALMADGLLSKLQKIEKDARSIQRRAERAGDLKAAIAAVGQLVRLVEVAARITGRIQEGGLSVEFKLDEEAAVRVARVFLQKRGLLPAPPAIEAQKVEP